MATDPDGTLAKDRATKRTALSLRMSSILRYVAERDYFKVNTKVAELKSSFASFEEAHTRYCGEEEVEDSYFEEVQSKYVETLTKVNAFLNAPPTSTPSESSSSSVPSGFRLPPAPQPQVFDGNPEAYPMWKASFSTLIDRTDIALSGEQKMFYLQKYLSGAARSAVNSLFLVPSSSSYSSAMTILEERFGSPHLVSSAFRRKLESWPRISARDHQGLQSFSDFLQQIKVASKRYPALSILDNEFENRKLVNKLPPALAARWVESVVDSPSFPIFETFADFVDRGPRFLTTRYGRVKVPHHRQPRLKT